MKPPFWSQEGDCHHISPHENCGFIFHSGRGWKCVCVDVTKSRVFRFFSREKAMEGLEIHLRLIHPEVTTILKAEIGQSVSPKAKLPKDLIPLLHSPSFSKIPQIPSHGSRVNSTTPSQKKTTSPVSSWKHPLQTSRLPMDS